MCRHGYGMPLRVVNSTFCWANANREMRLFRVFIPASVLALLLSEMALIIACYVRLRVWTLNVDPVVYLWDEDNYWKILFVSLCIILGFYLQDLYTEFRIASRIMLVQQVCLSVGAALLLMAMLGYIRIEWILPRWLMVIGSALVIVLVPTLADDLLEVRDPRAADRAGPFAWKFQHPCRDDRARHGAPANWATTFSATCARRNRWSSQPPAWGRSRN